MIYTIDQIKTIIEPIAKKYELKAVYIFGSYALNKASDDDEVRVLVDMEGSVIQGELDLGGLYEDLSGYLGKEIELVTWQRLEKEQDGRLMEKIRREAVKIWGDKVD